MKKVLISPGYGAGWSSWNSPDVGKFMAEYQPIIEAVERGEVLTENSEVVQKMVKEIEEKFNEDYVCLLGIKSLVVEEVVGSYRVHEYDGFESIQVRDEEIWW